MAPGKRAGGKARTDFGVCAVCGKAGRGIAAQPDRIILFARKVRSLLRMERHTMVCPAHLEAALQKRQKYEKMGKSFRLAALLVFILALFGPAAFGKFDLRMLLPAAIGAGLVLCLQLPYYYPKFADAEAKQPS